MVAADDGNRNPAFYKLCQKIIQQPHRFQAGHAFVVYIPGQQHRIRLFFVHNRQHLTQGVGLVLRHAEFPHPFAKVQVGQMNEFQRYRLQQRKNNQENISSFFAPRHPFAGETAYFCGFSPFSVRNGTIGEN